MNPAIRPLPRLALLAGETALAEQHPTINVLPPGPTSDVSTLSYLPSATMAFGSSAALSSGWLKLCYHGLTVLGRHGASQPNKTDVLHVTWR